MCSLDASKVRIPGSLREDLSAWLTCRKLAATYYLLLPINLLPYYVTAFLLPPLSNDMVSTQGAGDPRTDPRCSWTRYTSGLSKIVL